MQQNRDVVFFPFITSFSVGPYITHNDTEPPTVSLQSIVSRRSIFQSLYTHLPI